MSDTVFGWASYDNARPEQGRGQDSRKFTIVSRTETSLVFEIEEHPTSTPWAYLGCITNGDNTEVYWVNETNPLP